MFDLDDITTQTDQLEALSASASRLLSLFAEVDWEAEEVVEVVSLDAALTGRILRLANSARLGARQEAGTLDAAIVRIGMGAVLSTAIACSMRGTLDTELPQYELGDGDIWRHSVAASLVAGLLHKKCAGRLSQDIQTAALMHDVGKLLIARNLDRDECQLLGRARREGKLDWARAEREVLMVNHGDLGGLVAQHWHLPEPIVQAILFHHDPELMPGPKAQRSLAFGVQLCDIAANRINGVLDFGEPELVVGLQELELSRADFEAILSAAADGLDEVLACYG